MLRAKVCEQEMRTRSSDGLRVVNTNAQQGAQLSQIVSHQARTRLDTRHGLGLARSSLLGDAEGKRPKHRLTLPAALIKGWLKGDSRHKFCARNSFDMATHVWPINLCGPLERLSVALNHGCPTQTLYCCNRDAFPSLCHTVSVHCDETGKRCGLSLALLVDEPRMA